MVELFYTLEVSVSKENVVWKTDRVSLESLIDRAVGCIQGAFPVAETWIRTEGFWLSVDNFECKHFHDKLPKLLGALVREVKKLKLKFTVQYTFDSILETGNLREFEIYDNKCYEITRVEQMVR